MELRKISIEIQLNDVKQLEQQAIAEKIKSNKFQSSKGQTLSKQQWLTQHSQFRPKQQQYQNVDFKIHDYDMHSSLIKEIFDKQNWKTGAQNVNESNRKKSTSKALQNNQLKIQQIIQEQQSQQQQQENDQNINFSKNNKSTNNKKKITKVLPKSKTSSRISLSNKRKSSRQKSKQKNFDGDIKLKSQHIKTQNKSIQKESQDQSFSLDYDECNNLSNKKLKARYIRSCQKKILKKELQLKSWIRKTNIKQTKSKQLSKRKKLQSKIIKYKKMLDMLNGREEYISTKNISSQAKSHSKDKKKIKLKQAILLNQKYSNPRQDYKNTPKSIKTAQKVSNRSSSIKRSSSNKSISKNKKNLDQDIEYRYALNKVSPVIRKQFASKVVDQVPGRREQALNIFNYIIDSQNGSSTPICIHGNTGCGKTSLIKKILRFIDKQFPKKFSTAYLNCMSMWSVNHVYSGMLLKLFGFTQRKSQRVLNDLFLCGQGHASKLLSTYKPTKNCKKLPSVKKNQQNLKKTKIIVLDQIDHFIKDQTFIYNLLQWVHLRDSKIVLILISNIIDLSVQLSSKNQSRMKFQSIIFKPYNFCAIEQILHYKYPEASKLFEPKAINFLCRKVASINSDIRLLQKIYSEIVSEWQQRQGYEGMNLGQQMIRNQQSDSYSQPQQNDIEYPFERFNDEERKVSQTISRKYKKKKLDQQQIYSEDNDPDNSDFHSNEKDFEQKKQSQQSSNQHSRSRFCYQNSQRKNRPKRYSEFFPTIKKKITIENVMENLHLTGEANGQLPQILKGYQIILKVLHKARKKEEVSYEIMNKTFLRDKKMPTSQQTLLQLCELKDLGLISLANDTKNADATFQGFGVRVNQQLHLMCPEQ